MAGKVGLCPSLHADNAMAKNRMRVFAHKTTFSVSLCVYVCVCVVVVLFMWNPTFDKKLSVYIKTTIKQGTRLLLWCYYREQQGVTEKPPSPAMQPTQAFINPHSVSNRLTTAGASLNYFNKYRVLVQVSYSGRFIIFVSWHWRSWNK